MTTSGYFFATDLESRTTNYFQYTGVIRKDFPVNYLPDDCPFFVLLERDKVSFFSQALPKSGGLYAPDCLFVLDFSRNNKELIEENVLKEDIIKETYEKMYVRNTAISSSELKSYRNLLFVREKMHNEEGKYGMYVFLLDFLFDFFHSNVFTGNPYYEAIKNHLLTSPITNALIKKLEYSYYKEVVKGDLFTKQKAYYEGRLENAIKEWLALIRNKQYENVIHPNNCWFEPIETEH
jgi:hypothetical protein